MDRDELKCGVCLFDDEKEPGKAWVSVDGAPAKRVDGPNELATDVVWLTNVSFENFYKRTEIWRMPWLRHDGYLVAKPKDILKEWGVDPRAVGSDYAAALVSKVFGRVMSLSYRLVRDVEPRVRPDQVFRGRFLREDLRRLLPEVEYPRDEAAIIMKSGTAWQEFTTTTVRSPKGGRWIMLRKPRVAYASEMFQTPVPKGPFEYLMRGDLRAVASDRVRWLQETDRPCMAEIGVQSMSPEIAPVLGFGNAVEKEQRTNRSWIAHPEFIVLSQYAEVDVKAVWIGDEYDCMAPKLPEPVKDFMMDKHVDFSWSAGIVAETLWRAAVLAEEKKKGPQGDEKAHTSWQGAWMKAADKVATFQAALKLSERGHAVVSYGLGWLRVSSTDEAVPDLMNDALSIGLVPQLVDVPQNMFSMQRPIPWGGDQRSQFLAQMTAAGQRNMLWQMDQLPLMDRDQRNAVIQKLLLASRQGKL